MNDLYGKTYSVRYYRSELKAEVDFIVMQSQTPYMAMEVKSADESAHPALTYLVDRVIIPHAFQIAWKGSRFSIHTTSRGNKIRLMPALDFLSMLP